MINNKPQQELSLTDSISPAWSRFFEQGKEINTLAVKDWKPAHIVAYWCKCYEDYYKIKYTFKFRASPSKSYEVFRIRELSHNISADPSILKHYIDFVFKEKIVQKKRRITSLSVLVDMNYINEYKQKFLGMGSKTIDRATALPPNFIEVINNHFLVSGVKTYGDLAFLIGSDKNGWKKELAELEKAGMDVEILGRVK